MSTCPLPYQSNETVQLAHGGGGALTRSLVEGLFQPAFDNPLLRQNHDGTVLEIGGAKLAFTTDSYVVQPLFFPGGDIGKLAVCGTVNDLAMCGAKPLYLSAGFILEEGFPMADLERIVRSMQATAEVSGVQLVTGDTKVVDHGNGDGIFINTAGIGELRPDVNVGPYSVRPGDVVILSGDIGRHGISILAARQGLEFENEIESDCAPLNGVVAELLEASVEIHCLRDLTRGGVATALKEIAIDSNCGIHLRENSIPVSDGVRGASEMLGLDPLYIANEGRMVVILPEANVPAALRILQSAVDGAEAAVVGEVREGVPGRLTMETAIGARRVLDLLSGEQLPRIC